MKGSIKVKNKQSVYNNINEFNEENDASRNKKRKKLNFAIQIVSVICAVLLWFYVSGVESSTYEEDFNALDIELKNSDRLLAEQNFSVINGYNFTADVVLSGKKSTLKKIKDSDIKAYVDLSAATKAGQNELPVVITAPNGASVVSYEPMYVTVYVGKTTAREIPIEVNATYSAQQQYILGDYVFRDDSGTTVSDVTVTGPENELANVSKAQITVDFGTIEGSVTARGKIVLLDKNNNLIENPYIKSNISELMVTLPVYMHKTVSLSVAQKYNTFADNQIYYTLEPSTLTIKGEPSVLRDIHDIVVATIDETQINETHSYYFTIPLPNGVENADTTNIVNVSATLNNIYTNTITLDVPYSFDITPPSNNLTYTISTNYVQVKLIGTTDHVLSETAAGLSAKIDMSQYNKAGSYSIPVTVSVKNSSTCHVVGSYNVSVVIAEK